MSNIPSEIERKARWAGIPPVKHEEHELEFQFDRTGHPIVIRCSCGKECQVEML